MRYWCFQLDFSLFICLVSNNLGCCINKRRQILSLLPPRLLNFFQVQISWDEKHVFIDPCWKLRTNILEPPTFNRDAPFTIHSEGLTHNSYVWYIYIFFIAIISAAIFPKGLRRGHYNIPTFLTRESSTTGLDVVICVVVVVVDFDGNCCTFPTCTKHPEVLVSWLLFIYKMNAILRRVQERFV